MCRIPGATRELFTAGEHLRDALQRDALRRAELLREEADAQLFEPSRVLGDEYVQPI
jgi:hypothetical protein